MPRTQRVSSIGNILDLVITAIIRLGKVGRWTYNHICRHFRMNVAENRHHSGLRERESTFLTFGPGSKIVRRFLITIDRRPKSVVLHGITVQKVHRGALLDNQDVRRKHESSLIHDVVVLRCEWHGLRWPIRDSRGLTRGPWISARASAYSCLSSRESINRAARVERTEGGRRAVAKMVFGVG